MPPISSLTFENSFARLAPDFYEVVDPTPLTNPVLVALNPAERPVRVDVECGRGHALRPLLTERCAARVRAGRVEFDMQGVSFGVFALEAG